MADDLRNQRFGRWTALRRRRTRRRRSDGRLMAEEWWCRCVCGTERWIAAPALERGDRWRCKRCYEDDTRDDLTGKKFGWWLVLGPWRRPENETTCLEWWCRCRCGAERWVSGGNLRRRRGSKSCFACARERAGQTMRRKHRAQKTAARRAAREQSWTTGK